MSSTLLRSQWRRELSAWFMRLLAAVLFGVALTACASGPRTYLHTFEFDVRPDRADIQVLDYRYGDVGSPAARAPRESVAKGSVAQLSGITGWMPRPGSLYVRWRNKESGREFEETVDLSNGLPEDLTDHIVTFAIRDNQLFVYLVTPIRRPEGEVPNGPRKFNSLRVLTLHPDQSTAVSK